MQTFETVHVKQSVHTSKEKSFAHYAVQQAKADDIYNNQRGVWCMGKPLSTRRAAKANPIVQVDETSGALWNLPDLFEPNLEEGLLDCSQEVGGGDG